MRRENFIPTKSSKICSKHFTPDSYVVSGWSSKKQLKKEAIPSVFNFPSSLVKKIKPRKPPAKRKITSESEINIKTIKDDTSSETTLETASLDRAKRQSCNTFRNLKKIALESPLKRRKCYLNDLKKHQSFNIVLKLISKQEKKIKILQQRNRRLHKRVSNLQSLLKHLKEMQMIDEESSLKLSDTMPASTKTVFKQLLKSKCTKEYPMELKSFALTLNFYSPRAYSYVRKTFTKMLPHPRTLQK
ncbi:THAP domain-containing protein 1-like isoform X2 [Hydra vulgaris]